MFLLDTGSDLILYRGVGVGGGSATGLPPPPILPPPAIPVSNQSAPPLLHPPNSDVPPAGTNVHLFSSLALARSTTASRPQFGSPLNRSPLNRDRGVAAPANVANKGSDNNKANHKGMIDFPGNDEADNDRADGRDGRKGSGGEGDVVLSDRELLAVVSPPRPRPPLLSPPHAPFTPVFSSRPPLISPPHVPPPLCSMCPIMLFIRL